MNKPKIYPFAFAPGVIQRYPRRRLSMAIRAATGRNMGLALCAIVLTVVAARLGWMLGGAL